VESLVFARKRYEEGRVETMEAHFRNGTIDLFGEFDAGGFNLFGHWYHKQLNMGTGLRREKNWRGMCWDTIMMG
jgi:hypothetical protein